MFGGENPIEETIPVEKEQFAKIEDLDKNKIFFNRFNTSSDKETMFYDSKFGDQ